MTKLIKRSVHFQDITDHIQRFEEQNIEWLVQEEFMGWNLWSVVKKPLFYSFKHTHYKLKRSERKKPNRLLALARSLGTFIKTLFYLVTVRKADAVIAIDVNRSERENGRLVDKFFGPLLKEGVVRNVIYFEHNSLKDPAGIPRHVNTVHFNILSGLLWRRYAKKKAFIEKAQQFAERFNQGVGEDQAALKISSQKILELITYFHAEFVMYKFFWKWLRPKRVFIADGIPRGVVAASRFYRIPVFEYQHGFVSKKKADYIVDGRFKEIKNKMVIPDHIIVFGQYFKDLLLASGFWDQKEVLVLGSYPLDKARSFAAFQPSVNRSAIRMVWATQPTTFADAKKILEELAEQDNRQAVFYLRMHPLEPAAQKEWYTELAEKNPGRFELTPPGQNFFEALKGKQVLISFHSTVLLEAVALGYPVLSVSTEKYSNGINDLVVTDVSQAIRPVSGATAIAAVIDHYIHSPGYAEDWINQCREQGKYFFADHYKDKLKSHFQV